jgi:hypothetical protein
MTWHGIFPPRHELAAAGIQDVAEIQLQAVPHGPPPCCSSVALPHHRCELAVIDLPILRTAQRLIIWRTDMSGTKQKHGGWDRERSLTLF